MRQHHECGSRVTGEDFCVIGEAKDRRAGHDSLVRPYRLTRRRIGMLSLALAGALGVACQRQSSGRAQPGAPLIAVPARNSWPPQFAQASPEAQQAYRFAVAHPDVLQYIPCYCGCNSAGHTSNKDCYIREVRPGGVVVLDPHGFG